MLSFINANCGFKYPHVHGFEEDIPLHIMNSLPAIKMFTTRRGVIWAPLMAPGKPSHPGYSRRQGSSRQHAIFVKESALVGFIMLSYCHPSFYNQRMFSHKKSSLEKMFQRCEIFEGVFVLIRSGARVPLAKWAASTITLYINHQSHSSKDLGVLLHMVYTK